MWVVNKGFLFANGSLLEDLFSFLLLTNFFAKVQ